MESQYCLYYKNDRLQFGWIREVRKNKPVILPAQGKEFSCSSNRLEYIWNGSAFQSEKETLAYLSEKAGETIARSTEIELEVIHDLCETGIPYTLEDLADNFLDDPENGWSRVSLLINIKNDRKYFQQKKSQFFARSQEEIQKLEEEFEKKCENERRLVEEKEWAEQLRKGELPDISTNDADHWNTFLHRILNFLRYMEHSQERDYFCALFQCQVSESIVTERRLLEVLAIAGIKLSWGSLILNRVDAHSAYDEEELVAISEIKVLDIWNRFYDVETKDERHLSTHTVDSAETRDYDDAISLEKKEDGWALRIHIADVASFIGKESLLFKKGESRMSSLYTIKETLPMFHPDLSENVFSLCENSDRPALTFEAQIDLNGDLTDFQLYRSIINVDRNLSYEAVDAALSDEDPFWTVVWRFCQMLKKIRIENGSLELERTEIKLDISDPDHIKIKEVRENTPANMLVEELAIFTNHQSASYCDQHNLPCLYRNQPPYSLNRELAEDEKPTLRDIHIQPARIGMSPEGHSALGLDCYMQVTSPIRRFLDLINQSIIFSQLASQDSGYLTENLLSWARQGEEIQKEYAAIERRLQDHWKIKYLDQHKDSIFNAQLIRTLRNGKSLIRILDIQLVVECVMEEPSSEDFQVVLDQVIPKYDRVVARPYLAVSEGVEDEVNPSIEDEP